ncbi:MAG: CHAT domain-containing protein [Rubrivivax sp.]|nr:CHAT domain-containing protein [Rubrivivax sp.]
MAEEIQVRTVRVEFLRAGPAHNQLLSPLTPYLAVCDDAEAGVVHVPFEQQMFDRRMRAMRHDDQNPDRGQRPALKDRLPELREMGVAMGRLLGAVPRLPGSLGADPNGRDTVVRLSLTITASELAALPFELAKVPIAGDAVSEAWLGVQSRVPVVLTRRSRNVSLSRHVWLDRPRVLFIASSTDDEAVPYSPHLKALTDAVRPFAMSDRFGQRARLMPTPGTPRGSDNARATFGDMLTVLSNATLDGVARECASQRYTHVHILAHGRQDDALGDTSYGLVLKEADGVISGERLASALNATRDGELHRPQVVTLATCDSAGQRDLTSPGGSIALVLHQSGIPLVVGSQVPLGFDGSVLFAQVFYEGLLWGEHPWVLMHRVRSTLHSRLPPIDHDWAALAVYESLPSDMQAALERATYRQCQRATEVAYSSGRWVGSEAMTRAIERLIDTGQTYGMEARALRAAALMINARDELYDVEQHPQARTGAELRESLHFRRRCLEQALDDNDRALRGFIISDGHGLSAPFRALLSKLSIQLVLGLAPDWNEWAVARYWAEVTARDGTEAEDRAWAQACLAELWLLRSLDAAGPGATACEQTARQALRETVGRRQPLDRLPTTIAYWLDHRLGCYADAWIRADLREAVRLPQEPTEAVPELATLKEPALRLQSLLRDRHGLPEREAAGAAPLPAPSRPKAVRAARGTGTAGGNPAASAPSAPSAEIASPPGTALLGARTPPPASPAAAPASPARPATRPAARETSRPAKRAGTREAPDTATPNDPFWTIEMLPVDQGDCLWIEWGSRSGRRWRMLIDGGTEDAFKRALAPRLAALPDDPDQRRFELFILSHIDGDHIGGGIPLLQQHQALKLSFGDIWFNGRHHLEGRKQLSGKDGDDFSTLLQRGGAFTWNAFTRGKAIVRPQGDSAAEEALPSLTLAGGMRLHLLSPTPSGLARLGPDWDEDLAAPGRRRQLGRRPLETSQDLAALAQRPFDPDGSRPNGSSIAVMAEFAGHRALLAADAYAQVLSSAVQRLRGQGTARLPIDVFKLSHHGSRGNVNDELLAQIDCGHYLISTSGAVFAHPDRDALARIVQRSARAATLWFNYPPPKKNHAYHALWHDPAFQQRWGFQTRHPQAGQEGLKFDVIPAR